MEKILNECIGKIQNMLNNNDTNIDKIDEKDIDEVILRLKKIKRDIKDKKLEKREKEIEKYLLEENALGKYIYTLNEVQKLTNSSILLVRKVARKIGRLGENSE
jgi:hypothetical protein